MNRIRIYITIGVSILLVLFLEHFAENLIDGLQWVFSKTDRMASISIGAFDYIILGFLPLWSYLILNHKEKGIIKILTENFIMSLFIAAFIGIGIIVIIINGFRISPLLPEYIVNQPFSLYWSLFISIGIILPGFTIKLLRNRKKNKV